jgi:hypothetical protein
MCRGSACFEVELKLTGGGFGSILAVWPYFVSHFIVSLVKQSFHKWFSLAHRKINSVDFLVGEWGAHRTPLSVFFGRATRPKNGFYSIWL